MTLLVDVNVYCAIHDFTARVCRLMQTGGLRALKPVRTWPSSAAGVPWAIDALRAL